jgi:hypothetical protein
VVFIVVFGKLRASSDYYKRDRTRNLRTCCAKVLIKNSLKKGHEMQSGYLESRTCFRIKKRHCLSTGLKLQVKAK